MTQALADSASVAESLDLTITTIELLPATSVVIELMPATSAVRIEHVSGEVKVG